MDKLGLGLGTSRSLLLPLAAAAILLNGCGDGGGQIASTPAPSPAPTPSPSPTPTPAATSIEPATTTGSYGAIAAVVSSSGAAFSQPGDIAIAVDAAAKTYTLTINKPVVAVSSPVFQSEQSHQEATLANGDRLSNALWVWLNRNKPGPHYVSLAEWGYSLRNAAPDDTEKAGYVAYFVFGQRTTAADIPTSGTATYNSAVISAYCECNSTVRLSADFAARSMASELGLDGFYETRNTDGSSATKTYAVRLAGTGPISSLGSFDMNLAGTVDNRVVGGGAVTTTSVAGSLTGALFGPGAAEAGGAFRVTLPDNLVIGGAFVSTRN